MWGGRLPNRQLHHGDSSAVRASLLSPSVLFLPPTLAAAAAAALPLLLLLPTDRRAAGLSGDVADTVGGGGSRQEGQGHRQVYARGGKTETMGR